MAAARHTAIRPPRHHSSQHNHHNKFKMNKTLRLILSLAVMTSLSAAAADIKARLSIKTPGNAAVSYQLSESGDELRADRPLPVVVTKSVTRAGDDEIISVTLRATERAYVNFGAQVSTGFRSGDCEFYLPGFWYHRNMRSPKEAPSFHTSKSWNFREDRLSSPLSGAYDSATGHYMTVMHEQAAPADALTTHSEGEVILSGDTSLGYLGFDADGATTQLTFGYPYVETPRRYIRKLTLAPSITAFVKIEKGESKTIKWRLHKAEAKSYGDFVSRTWEYCFDRLNPQPMEAAWTAQQMKAQLANYFTASYVDKYALKYNSGVTLRVDDCKPAPQVQLGFCGRVLLNAFNALEYGEQTGKPELVNTGNAIFDSFLKNGITDKGYFFDEVYVDRGMPASKDVVHSIRQQSEAIYAVLHYLDYERQHKRRHKEWESRVRAMLDNFVTLIKPDGSYARKFHDDGSDIDGSGGSTPSATSTLVMGYKYFGDKRYLATAKRTVDYLEKNIISKSDYFSSTLDANCEDKEAAISAVTATYYLAMATTGKESQHYAALCRQAAYFALSWYYLWDIPFAQGQMLGDLGLKTRGWGNVSVENNHIDVFVFELPHIVKWLGQQFADRRFLQAYDVIYTSLSQLLPTEGHLCGVGVPGFYPEVVQHTTWDYGRNGKGFYNDIFAPGWTVASLWELYSPDRTAHFLTRKR